MTLDELRTRATITVPELAALLEVGLNQAYSAVRGGLVPSIRVGRVIRIPTPGVLELLGASQTSDVSEDGPASPSVAATKPAEGAPTHGDTTRRLHAAS